MTHHIPAGKTCNTCDQISSRSGNHQQSIVSSNLLLGAQLIKERLFQQLLQQVHARLVLNSPRA
jgi:hypothetical protein